MREAEVDHGGEVGPSRPARHTPSPTTSMGAPRALRQTPAPAPPPADEGASEGSGRLRGCHRVPPNRSAGGGTSAGGRTLARRPGVGCPRQEPCSVPRRAIALAGEPARGARREQQCQPHTGQPDLPDDGLVLALKVLGRVEPHTGRVPQYGNQPGQPFGAGQADGAGSRPAHRTQGAPGGHHPPWPRNQRCGSGTFLSTKWPSKVVASTPSGPTRKRSGSRPPSLARA